MSNGNDEFNRFNIDIPDANVCMFSSAHTQENPDVIDATRFIYETSPEKLGEAIVYPAFGCHLVTGGSAVFVAEGNEHKIEIGDVFFTFPMIPFGFKNIDGLKYLYVNFVGAGAELILASVGISRRQTVFKKVSDLIDIWFLALDKCNSENLRLLAKGVLYYSLAMLPCEHNGKTQKRDENIAEIIRKSIDISYHNHDLSIEYYAQKYGYNSKYLSRKFADAFHTPFSEYLKSCRIGHACVLLAETTRTIQDVATAVGYHDPLYFSKVFKNQMKQSPTEYRKSQKK